MPQIFIFFIINNFFILILFFVVGWFAKNFGLVKTLLLRLLFLSFHNILSIGFLAAFLGLGSAVFTLLVGKHSDRVGRKKILRAGAIAMMIIWIGRYFAMSQISFYALSILAGFLGALISVPFNSIFYVKAKNNHIEDFVIFREIPISLGRVFLYSAGLLLASQVKIIFLFALIPYLFLLFFSAAVERE